MAKSVVANKAAGRGGGNGNGSPPRKKKEKSPSMKDRRKMKQKNAPMITVRAFHSCFTMEAYFFEKNDGNDAFLHSYKKYTDNEITCSYLEAAGFTDMVYRRRTGSDNDILVNSDDKRPFWRAIMIRYPPGGESTPETRQEGLTVARQFFLDSTFSDYPPKNIQIVDATSMDNPPPLDDFFLNKDIETFMKEDIEEDLLNGEFYEKYPALARKCWGGNFPSPFARSLGYPA